MKQNRPLSSEQFKDIYSKVTRLTVLVVIMKDNSVLLTLRDVASWKGMWHVPGGTVLYKEKVEDAVKRVAKEEIDLEVVPEKMLGYIEYPSEETERGFGWAVSLPFLCRVQSGEIALDEQASKADYFKTLPENMVEEEKWFLEKNWERILLSVNMI